MKKLESYINGQWCYGSGEGIPMKDAVTGRLLHYQTLQDLDFSEVLHYGRSKGEALRKMTFQERGNMLKKLALSSNKKETAFLRS